MSQTRQLSLIIQTPGCLPPLLWGDYGTAKSSIVRQIAAALGLPIKVLCPGQHGEGAFGVVPVPVNGRLTYPPSCWVDCFPDGRGLLFIDEINTAPPALQPALLGLALDGVLGDHQLPPGVRRVAAANPSDQAAGGWDLAAPLANRFVHVPWTCPDAGEWVEWLTGGDVRADVVNIDLDAWEQQWLQAKALGAAFVRRHPSALHEQADKILGRYPPAVATPRTWEAALRLLASCRAVGCMDLYPRFAAGCLGEPIGVREWCVWLKENDLPDPELLLADPDSWTPDPARPDQSYATLLAVASAGLAEKNGKKLTEKERVGRWNAALHVCDRGLTLAGKDIVLLAARRLVNRDKRPKSAKPDRPESKRCVTVLADFIDAHDLVPMIWCDNAEIR